jgi:ABC-type transport system involved in multi-copper enzyme maturation permease subunit
MIKALFWKEWQQQRWKLAYGCVLVMGCTLIGLRSRLLFDEGIVIAAAVGGAVFTPLLVSLGLVAAERNEGSLDMLLALPVRHWHIFTVKMVMAALVCAAPILGSALVSLIIAAGREQTAGQIITPYLGGLAFGVTMLVWVVGFGVGQPSEARAGLVGIAVFVGWVFLVFLSETLLKLGSGRWSLVITPFGLLEGTIDARYSILPKVVLAQLGIAFCLLLWAAHRFGRVIRTKA